jgi:flagellar protein FlgJ
MSANAVTPSYYADFSGLDGLKKSAQAHDPGALREAARQFESLFTNMLLKTMRETKFGDALGDSQETEFYQGMYDQQLAVQLSKGKGLGLADMLVQQLSRTGTAAGTLPAPAPAKGSPAVAAPAPATPANGGVSHAQRLGFIRQIEPLVTRAANVLGVSVDAIIAQAALETGWGSHSPATATGSSSFNLFGIKQGGAWSGATAPARTTEVLGGKATQLTQNFRSYGSPQASVADYVALLQGSPRYSQALGTGDNIHAFATALARGGYATDPDYVNKLAATAGSIRELRATATALPLNIVAGQPTSSGAELI